MPGDPTQFTLKIDGESDSTDEEKIELARRLRKELLKASEVQSVESPAIPVVPGAKSVGVDWQTLIVTFAASGGVLTTLIGAVQNWFTRQEKASVTVDMGGEKLTITGASSEAQKSLVEDWIRRHQR